MKSITHVSALAMAVLLAGCSGSDSNSGRSNTATPEQTFNNLSERGAALREAAAELPATVEMPTTGTATYDGVAEMVGGDGDFAVTGAITMEANFAEGSIGGKIDSFGSDNETLEGQINIVDGYVKGNSFTANLDGSLKSGDEAANVITGTLDGGFLGENAEMVSGDINAISQQQGESTEYFSGTFNAEKK